MVTECEHCHKTLRCVPIGPTRSKKCRRICKRCLGLILRDNKMLLDTMREIATGEYTRDGLRLLAHTVLADAERIRL